MYVCLWIYWLVNQQASVITCGEVAERWHKAASSGIERKWEREKERVFLTAVRLALTLTSCLCPLCHPSCWQMKWPCSLTSQRFVLLHKISAVTSDSLLVILTESWRCILSRYGCFFTGRATQISDLRSVETPPVHSSTQFQHLIIFSAAVACRFFTYHLGCCCFFFVHPREFHF